MFFFSVKRCTFDIQMTIKLHVTNIQIDREATRIMETATLFKRESITLPDFVQTG